MDKKKTTNILYWVVTGLFAGFMLLGSIPNLMSSADSVAFLNGKLGYPVYIIPFLGAAKILGAIALLIPSFRLIKEWAYAGFFYDLSGAAFSIISLDGFKPDVLFMGVFIGFLLYSYHLWHKKLAAATV